MVRYRGRKRNQKGKIMNNIKLFVGCDPDTKHQAFGSINLDGTEVNAWVIKSSNSDELTQCRAHLAESGAELYDDFIAMVEGQKVYAGDKKSNPASLIKLARSSGLGCMYLANSQHCKGIQIALPQEWKGSVQKHAHQAQILKSLGQEPIIKGSGTNKYAVPKEDFLNMSMTEYKHCIDAIGMAMRLRKDYLWKQKKEKILNAKK